MITIVDYGMCNVGSIANMIKKAGGTSIISSNPTVIAKANKLVFPGVGAFDTGMTNIKKRKLLEVLNLKVVKEKVPILGVCLGMQLMTEASEEGKLDGLGWIKAKTIKFDKNSVKQKLLIPHMGWNTIKPKKKSVLLKGLEKKSRFYFVHSYHVVCENKKDILTMTNYGYDFCSGFEKNNIFGVQFHPEKSHKYGMRIYKNFIDL